MNSMHPLSTSALRHWLFLIIILFIWETVWRLIALWKAGRNNQMAWFIVMGILNTAGILEIVYIVFFQKKTPKTPENTDQAPAKPQA